MAITPEWVMATSTGLVLLAAAWWVLRWQGWLWRRTIWGSAGADLSRVAGLLECELVVLWAGYSLRRGGLRVDIVGTIQGLLTRYRGVGPRRDAAGIEDPEAWVAYLGAKS